SPRTTKSPIVAVLGRHNANADRLSEDVRALFEDYHDTFNLGSKPSAHLSALAELSDTQLLAGLPEVLDRLIKFVRSALEAVPE
ncbi:hypothetical protein, partial [Actinotalea ferrariae]|uniref:hypothetical protein n=1 Tax=Actinotalea ferrariae TaxID=1386098 RepID=UPI001C1E1031